MYKTGRPDCRHGESPNFENMSAENGLFWKPEDEEEPAK